MKQKKYNLLDDKLREKIEFIWGELDFLMNKEAVVLTKDDEQYLLRFTGDIEAYIQGNDEFTKYLKK